MVKKLAILGFILVVVAAAGMVWAGTYTGAIPAPQPTIMPAAAPCAVAPTKGAKRLVTTISVKMKYHKPPSVVPPVSCGPPPIPVAVPMWKFIVPWPPYVYYLPVE